MTRAFRVTRPTTEAILSAVPALASYARPAGEPWPYCSVPEAPGTSDLPPTAMIPVIQVFRRDAPSDWWPEDADVFQLL